jgi:predicted TIM-barrel fold metal-dependent hydrolase
MVPASDFLINGAYRPRTAEDRRTQWAGERAYNRWLVEYCSGAPGRFVGLMFLPWHDLDQAVREVRWGAEHGLRGALFPPFNYDAPGYTMPHWEPLWSVCEEVGFSLNCHGGYGIPEWGSHLTGPASATFSLEHSFFMGRVFSHLVFAGVFDRHPALQIAFTESLAFWLPPALDTMERAVDGMLARARYENEFPIAKLPERRPWEYWYSNGHVGVSVLAMADLELWPRLGAHTMMHGIDYPHPEGSWGHARDWLRATFGLIGIREPEARQMLGLNAVALHRLDLDALTRAAARVGPTVEEILTPITDAELDELVADARAGDRGAAVRMYQNAAIRSQAVSS